jgi:crotonobetainyl-CoA:carnitine CoA-transferase CaiB-like acyl-CoA transferase
MTEQLFSDLLVIDCASFIAGPAAGTILGDFGARVIKIEPPGMGDGYRMITMVPGAPVSDRNYPWTLTNRNKQSLALDLKQGEGRAILDTLIERADVFITNYPDGVRAGLKLRYEDVREVNPGIIYASMTAYGETGPEAGNTGYDATAWWARSGLMDFVRASRSTPPAVSVPGMGDHMAANSLYGGIVTALYRRQKTGEGGMVSSSLMANGLWSNGFMVQAALDGADMTVRLDREQYGAFTQVYSCRDERWFMLTILPQAQEAAWPRLARCCGREEWLQDSRFADTGARAENNEQLTQLMQAAFMERDWDDWQARFAENHITCGGVFQPQDLCDDEQVAAAGIVTHFEGSSDRTIDSPIYVSGEVKRAPRPAPGVGEHSEKILAELGIDAKTVDNLRQAGVIGTP